MVEMQLELHLEEQSRGYGTVKHLVIEILSEAGISGMSSPELCAEVLKVRSASSIEVRLKQLARQGAIASLGRAQETRYFSTPEHAERGRKSWEAWCRVRRASMKERARAEKARLAREAYADAKRRDERAAAKASDEWVPDDLGSWKPSGLKRGRAPWSVDTPAVITPETKITVCPSQPAPTRTNTHGGAW